MPLPQPKQITPGELFGPAWCCFLWLASCSIVANSIPQVTHLKRLSLLFAFAVVGVSQLLSLLSGDYSIVFPTDEYLGSGMTNCQIVASEVTRRAGFARVR